ncbi:MAG: hypothetical protein FJ290_02730 [Planctomycetes bacterium]|nr:hypothetical protein [Planctomycetota bacterium]
MVRGIAVLAAALAIAAASLAGEEKAPPPEQKAPDKKGAPKEKKPPKPPELFGMWADKMRSTQGHHEATGNATIIKGDMRIDADNVVVDIDEKTNEFKKMTATGNVRVNTVEPISQRTTDRPPLKPLPEGRSALCDKATYDAATGIVVLHGTPEAQPVVRFGKNEVRADLITHDGKKGVVTCEGNVVLTALLPVKGDEKAPPPKKAEPPKDAPPAK